MKRVLSGQEFDLLIFRDIIELQLIQMGIPKKDIDEMSDDVVIRKWIVALEIMEKAKESMPPLLRK